MVWYIHDVGAMDGPFTGLACDTVGASNENDMAAVPATAETVSSIFGDFRGMPRANAEG